ncbi:tRNA pseudouridine(38-40) synthase TruA [Noviherbaspirillum pedocola]|uniref:tRNA pseudouridine synthase A n=1 Tax=Noviherbaspirillum pedocola TaxID=2801341 RepID=A0A934SYI4_9BURK|nr:tRNA pseudouridine(38-40) synthase TruA [Noviherbaspirillum pedocola]MBK4734078.1 tRNA pseudouridine(38-40) synthase TruA [Noviherbaspirillum pedocola]
MKRIAIGIQYDGASWQGWQTQPHGNTVQDRLQAALREFGQRDILVHCAGRTDAGVHALEQVAHFDTDLERPMQSWVRGVNTYLPPSIAISWAHPVGTAAEDGFHARFSAVARTYHYYLYNNPVRSPLLRGRAGWVFRQLDTEAMHRAAQHLIGDHDFSAFRAAECQALSPVRTMEAIRITRSGDLLRVSLTANAFLHHMVRNIVGSLVYVGTGNRPESWIAELLAGRDRRQAAPTFMPDGLYLAKIEYDPIWNLPQPAIATPIPFS